MKKAPNDVDRHVGSRVRKRRVAMGMSQEKLGDALGLTFQQVQKYEKGTNRISASRLQQISTILGVTIDWLYGGLGDAAGTDGFAEKAGPGYEPDVMTGEALAVAKALRHIEDPKVRKALVDLVQALAGPRAAS